VQSKNKSIDYTEADLIRFIGDKLDKISKLILVCMRYFILTEISYFIWGDNL
jgi:hypothetical protein